MTIKATLVYLATGCLMVAPGARAATTFSPYATVGIEYNSNVFAAPSDQPPLAASGDYALGDTITHYLAGATAKFAWERDELSLNGDVEQFEYQHFDELDHGEYKFGGLFNYHLGPIVDGSLEYQQRRYMAPTADTMTTQLEINTDRLASGTVRILVTPEWRFGLQPKWHQLDTPLPDYPNFALQENIADATLDYLGFAKVTAGLLAEYTDGKYSNIAAATKYTQWTEQLTANYAVTGLSSFNGQIGFTHRNSALVDPAEAGTTPDGGQGGDVGQTSAVTGALGFHRALSVKTSVDLRVFREVDSYTAGANSEIGTGGEVGVKWDPDVKISVTLHYRLATDSIQGNLATTNVNDRTDHLHSASADLTYKAASWLTVRPYVEYDKRTSNDADANYNATRYGIELTARWP